MMLARTQETWIRTSLDCGQHSNLKLPPLHRITQLITKLAPCSECSDLHSHRSDTEGFTLAEDSFGGDGGFLSTMMHMIGEILCTVLEMWCQSLYCTINGASKVTVANIAVGFIEVPQIGQQQTAIACHQCAHHQADYSCTSIPLPSSIFSEIWFLENKLYTNQANTEFARLEMDFMGHVLSWEEVKPNPKKAKAIREWLRTTTVKGVRSFGKLLQGCGLRYSATNPRWSAGWFPEATLLYLKVSTFFASADISIAIALKKNVIYFRSSRFVVLPRPVIIGRPWHLMRTVLQII